MTDQDILSNLCAYDDRNPTSINTRHQRKQLPYTFALPYTHACGCFIGTIDEFEKRVKETHNGNKHEREYLAMIALVKIKFEDVKTTAN